MIECRFFKIAPNMVAVKEKLDEVAGHFWNLEEIWQPGTVRESPNSWVILVSGDPHDWPLEPVVPPPGEEIIDVDMGVEPVPAEQRGPEPDPERW